MCYRVHDLERRREKAADQRGATTVSLRSRLDERWAALMAWLQRSVKPTPVTATLPPQPEPTEPEAKPQTAHLAQASTGTESSAKAREREAETV
jgi:hypothetical protein